MRGRLRSGGRHVSCPSPYGYIAMWQSISQALTGGQVRVVAALALRTRAAMREAQSQVGGGNGAAAFGDRHCDFMRSFNPSAFRRRRASRRARLRRGLRHRLRRRIERVRRRRQPARRPRVQGHRLRDRRPLAGASSRRMAAGARPQGGPVRPHLPAGRPAPAERRKTASSSTPGRPGTRSTAPGRCR